MGCYGVRPVRGGTLDSTHSYGAAIDLSYRMLDRERVRNEMIGYMVGWSFEWQIGMIIDYLGGRIWRAGRTTSLQDACHGWWKAQKPDSNGMGQSWGDWFHVEVTMAGWHDGTDEAGRGIT